METIPQQEQEAATAIQSQSHAAVKFAKTIEEAQALGIPVISPLRTTNFKFQLFKSNLSQSNLTDDARRNLFEDALYLEKEIVTEKLERFKNGLRVQNGKGALRTDIKRLASHYQVTPRTVNMILRRGRAEVSTQSKIRPGRKKAMTPSKASLQILKI